jgi:hypothetical protein
MNNIFFLEDIIGGAIMGALVGFADSSYWKGLAIFGLFIFTVTITRLASGE